MGKTGLFLLALAAFCAHAQAPQPPEPENYLPEPLFVQPGELYTDEQMVRMGVRAEPVLLNNRGVELHKAGDLAGARRAYEEALGEAQKAAAAAGHMAPVHQTRKPQIAANLGLVRWQLGDAAGAVDAFRTALAERAAYEGSIYDPYNTERAALGKARIFGTEADVIMTLARHAGALDMALVALLERKGIVLERQALALASMRRGIHASGEAAARQLLAAYEAATAERAALAGQPIGSAAEEAARRVRAEELEARIRTMQRELSVQQAVRAAQPGFLDMLRLGIERDGSAMAERQQRRIQERSSAGRESLLRRVQENIPAGAVLVEMARYRPFDPAQALSEARRFGPARYGAYLLSPDGAPQYVDLGEAEPLEQLVADFRRALADPARPARELARQLDERLMRPVRARIGDTNVYVAPEGALNLVPLAALVDEAGRYLLERYTFNYLASGRDLLLRGSREAPKSGPMVIANPAFTLAGGGAGVKAAGTRSLDFGAMNFSPLPGTAAEAQALKKLLPDATVLTGAGATESAAKGVRGPSILHIATHGFFLEDAAGGAAGDTRSLQVAAAKARTEDPMLRSGLVFAGVNGLRSGRDDGVLTALEAAALDLRGTKLVVLSACETGLGEVRNGEGVFGLRRAFAVAGAETLLMSLWQVADEATMQLMARYYAEVARGAPRAEALRTAQRALLEDPKTAAPFFWAAFISAGEAGPL
ncbi:MAG TPA: CHAT domain-containing protein [Burkholderiales bacterium]|nr:CHAT domain-containing protein [Burkholderiales bacterium]